MELIVNETSKQFELHLEDGSIALIEYVVDGDKMYLTHTEVPKSHEGKGIGQDLVKQTLSHLRKRGFQLVPLCSFVAWYVNNHDEWHSILSEGYQM